MGCCQVPTPVVNDGTKGASKEQTGYYDMVNEIILNKRCIKESQSKRVSITPSSVLCFLKYQIKKHTFL